MSENRISLIVEGMEQNKGGIELDIFLSELKAFKKVLLKIDESIGKGKRLNQFSVVGLSHSSPATVELEVRPKKLENDLSEQVFYRFHEFIKTVDDRGVPRDSDIPILEELKKLISPIGRELATVSIKMNETEVVLSQDVSLYISKILESEDSCPTSVEGMLEQINVHKNSIDKKVAEKSRELRNYYILSNPPLGKLSIADSIHLSTAIIYDVDLMYTFDGTNPINNNGTLKLIPLNKNVAGFALKIESPRITGIPFRSSIAP